MSEANTPLTKILNEMEAKCAEIHRVNDDPYVELPWLLDDKFEVVHIERLIAALKKAVEQRYSRAASLEHHDEWKLRLDEDLAAILTGEGGKRGEK